MAREQTPGDAAKDGAMASQGHLTGTSYNLLLNTQRQLREQQSLRGQRSVAPNGDPRSSRVTLGDLGSSLLFFVFVAPGILIVEKLFAWVPSPMAWLSRHGDRLARVCGVAGAALGLSPIVEPYASSFAHGLGIDPLIARLGFAVVLFGVGVWLFPRLIDFLERSLMLMLGLLCVVLTVSLYLAATFVGYQTYVHLFGGSEIPWLSATFDLIVRLLQVW